MRAAKVFKVHHPTSAGGGLLTAGPLAETTRLRRVETATPSAFLSSRPVAALALYA